MNNKPKPVAPNIGDRADISGHEELIRTAPDVIIIQRGDDFWVLRSHCPIDITRYNGYYKQNEDQK